MSINQVKVGWRAFSSPVVSGTDTDAQAFITAAGITNTTQQSAINTLVTQLKTYGIWTKMKALYPFVGGSATSHKFNLKDPRDLDAAFRLTFYGGGIHSSTGYQLNGSNSWGDANLVPSSVLTNNNVSIGFYSRTNRAGANRVVMGSYDSAINSILDIFARYTDNKAYFGLSDDGNGNNPTVTSTLGFYQGARNNSSTQSLSNINGTSYSYTYNSKSLPTTPFYVGSLGSLPTQYVDSIQLAFAYVGDNLSATDLSNYYTAVQIYQTTLGRHVGVPIVADADAQAFLNAAVITDGTQASAVNTLVTDLKSANIWTKMKALYPMVGGTAASHKFNLKDPRDVDAAFRLVFSGGWTHTSTGALPNGTTAYADTQLIPSSVLSLYSVSLSYYSRTNTTGSVGKCELGCTFGTVDLPLLQLAIRRREGSENDRFIGHIYAYNQAVLNTASTNSQGFFQISRTNSTNSFSIRNNAIQQTQTATSYASQPSTKVFIAALNVKGTSISNYSDREVAFSSIGDGLTDAEAAAFYTAVQKYQTTLGRQVGTPVLAEGQTAGLLDTYSSAAAAYSLRKLRNGYYGFAIRVRRSSDNAEQDIAFKTDGTLDTTSLLAFVGSGNGFVTTWYDQSGNISNLIQTTAANQARIVYNGVLETLNGKPALVTNYNYSNSGFYKATYSSTINGPATVFNIGSNVATAGASYLWDGLNTNMYAYSYNNTWMRIGGSAEFALTGYTQGITTQRIINAIYNGASSKLRINNGTYTTGNTGTIAATGLTLGGANGGGYLAPAYNQEHIVYPSNQETNATNINTNINSYYSIY